MADINKTAAEVAEILMMVDNATNGGVNTLVTDANIDDIPSNKIEKPSVEGSNGQVLTTNGSGGVSWTDKLDGAALNTAVTGWLDTNVDPTGAAVMVDSSLTITGAAADAKVTGDEITDLKSALNTEKTSSQENTGYREYDWELGWINTTTPDEPTSTETKCHVLVACAENDVFHLQYTGGANSLHRPYAWLDSNKAVISKLETNAAYNNTIAAPTNAAYLLCNSDIVQAHKLTSGEKLIERVNGNHDLIYGVSDKYINYRGSDEFAAQTLSSLTLNCDKEIISINGSQSSKYWGARISGAVTTADTSSGLSGMEHNLTLISGHKYRLSYEEISGSKSLTNDAFFSIILLGYTSTASFTDGAKTTRIYDIGNNTTTCILVEASKGNDGTVTFNNFRVRVLLEDITNEVITPQMYGAKGDGVNDDTAAFQLALDSGDVYVPTANNEVYKITNTLIVRNGKCKRLYSNGGWRGSSTSGVIKFDLSNNSGQTLADLRGIPLISVTDTQMFHIFGVSFTCPSQEREKVGRVGLFISCTDNTCDYDINISQSRIGGFYRVVRFRGRGFTVENSTIASVNYIGYFMWNDAIDTNNNHPDQYDQRAITFKNNRLHAIISGYIYIRSGHAYGLTFANNTCDNGKGYLLSAAETAWNWIVTGNLVQGVSHCETFIRFKSGARNCNISSNIFVCDNSYWLSYKDKEHPENNISATVPPLYWIRADGSISKCVICDNVFKGSQYSPIYVENADHNTISSNVFDNIAEEPGSGIDPDAEHEESDDSGDAPDPEVPVYGVVSVSGNFNYNIYAFNNGISSSAYVHSIEYEEGATATGNIIENNLPAGT